MVTIYLELAVLQKKKIYIYIQKSIFLPEVQRNLDVALASFVSGNKVGNLLESCTWAALNVVLLIGYL